MAKPIVVSIAGHDCSAGAGAAMDLAVIQAMGGLGRAILTAVTAQSANEVLSVQILSVRQLQSQWQAVKQCGPLAAIKSGMLANHEHVEWLSALLDQRVENSSNDIPSIYVMDPVFSSSSGTALASADVTRSILDNLLPKVTLLTPNRSELGMLCGEEIGDSQEAQKAASGLLDKGCQAVLLKGGHFAVDPCTDVLMTGSGVTEYAAPRVVGVSPHGTGCMLSAAIATNLASGLALEESVKRAKQYTHAAILHASQLNTCLLDPFYPLGPAGTQV